MVASHRGDQKIGGKDVRIKKSHIGQDAGNREPEMVREHELVIKVSACIFLFMMKLLKSIFLKSINEMGKLYHCLGLWGFQILKNMRKMQEKLSFWRRTMPQGQVKGQSQVMKGHREEGRYHKIKKWRAKVCLVMCIYD